MHFGQHIRSGGRVLTDHHGFAFLQLYPWKSIKIEQLACTELKVHQLSPVGDGVALSISYKNRLFCPSRALVRITSNFVSQKSGITGDLAGRLVKLNGTQMAASTAVDGAALLGVNEGSLDASYGRSTQAIASGQYVRSLDNSPLPPPQISPEPYIDSVGRQKSGLYRVCTHLDNQILVDGIAAPQTGENQTCADLTLDTKWLVLTPTGKYLGWRFPASSIKPISFKASLHSQL